MTLIDLQAQEVSFHVSLKFDFTVILLRPAPRKVYPGERKGISPLELWQKVQSQLESNLKARRNRAREQTSSLLTGLIEDTQGNRFTPSFTIRRGRRYRYYVFQAVVQNPGEEYAGVTRLPAHEIESRVMERLVGFLKSSADVFEQLGGDGQTPTKLQHRTTAAKNLADKLSSLTSADPRDLLPSFLRRVAVGEEQIRVTVSRNDLCRLLINGGRAIANRGEREKQVNPSDLICLSIDVRLKR